MIPDQTGTVYQTDTSLIKSLKILVNRMSLTSIFRNTKRSKWTFGLITNESNHSNKNPISLKMKIFTISIPSRNGTFLNYESYDLFVHSPIISSQAKSKWSNNPPWVTFHFRPFWSRMFHVLVHVCGYLECTKIQNKKCT